MIFATLLSLLVSFLLFYIIDSSFLETRNYEVSLHDKEHTAQYITTTTTMSGNTPITTTIIHPESWSISVKHVRDIVNCSVDEHEYVQFEKDKVAFASMAIGRFSGDTYCKGFSYKDNRGVIL